MSRDTGKSRKPAAKRLPTAPKRGLIRRILGLLPALFVMGLVAWVGIFYFVGPDLPDTDELFKNARQARVTLLANDGSIITERGAVGPEYVRLDEISPYVEAAVLATEDRRFYRHFGLDLIGTARAVLANFSAGQFVAGGSTVTQQLAKNLYLTPERSIKRKLKELVLALWLEARLSKEEILEVYLNRVYLGAGAYGIQAAAQRYFSKNAADITLPEAAMLAGLLKAPSRYAPTNDLALAQARAKTVLQGMVDAGMLDQADADAAAKIKVEISSRGSGVFAGHFVDYVLEGLTEHLGKPEEDWVILTTLDPRLQKGVEAAIAKHLAGRGNLEAALVLMDRFGAIRAMAGGKRYRMSDINRAATSKRQPGSAFKPFVYLTALEKGLSADSKIEDAPFKVGDWEPRNGGNKYYGSVSLEEAFARSLNTVAVKLSEDAGRSEVAAKAKRLGIQSELREVASIALGTSEVTPLELTAAYLPFAAEGVRRPPFAVERVSDASAGLLFAYAPSEINVIDPKALAEMRKLFRAVVVDGSGQAASLSDRPVYGKTGTTSGARDAWFVGFSDDYVAGVWVGRDDNQPMKGVSGSNLPAIIWRDAMALTPRDAPNAPRPVERPNLEEEPLDLSTVLAKKGLETLFNWIEGQLEEAMR